MSFHVCPLHSKMQNLVNHHFGKKIFYGRIPISKRAMEFSQNRAVSYSEAFNFRGQSFDLGTNHIKLSNYSEVLQRKFMAYVLSNLGSAVKNAELKIYAADNKRNSCINFSMKAYEFSVGIPKGKAKDRPIVEEGEKYKRYDLNQIMNLNLVAEEKEILDLAFDISERELRVLHIESDQEKIKENAAVALYNIGKDLGLRKILVNVPPGLFYQIKFCFRMDLGRPESLDVGERKLGKTWVVDVV